MRRRRRPQQRELCGRIGERRVPHQFEIQPLELVTNPLQPRLAFDHALLRKIVAVSRLVALGRADHLELNITQYCEHNYRSSELRALAPRGFSSQLIE